MASEIVKKIVKKNLFLDGGPRYRKIPPAAVANQIVGKPRIPLADK